MTTEDAHGSMLAAALAYARAGLPVFPITPGGKLPAIQSAHQKDDPLRGSCHGECGREGHGFYDATTDEAAIRRWWERWPDANIGLRTGEASGIDVVDPDAPKESGDADGRAALNALEDANERIPLGPFVNTPSGGWHVYFRHAAAMGSAAGRIGPRVDHRGDGGYVLVPPSRTAAGAYTWGAGLETPLPDWPAWLLALAMPKPRAEPEPVAAGVPVAVGSTAGTPYGVAALRAECDALAGLAGKTGTRNATLNRAAFAIGQLLAGGELRDEAGARAAIASAARATGLEDAEIERTLDSGLAAGMTEPRVAPPKAPRATPGDVAGDGTGPTGGLAPLPFRSLRVVASDVANRPPIVPMWPHFLARGQVACLAGAPKSGKSEVVAAFMASVTLGALWLGVSNEVADVVLVTEESDADLVGKLIRHGADLDRVHVLNPDAGFDGGPPSWGRVIEGAREVAARHDAAVVVVDTLAAWAGFSGDDERSEGVVGPAVRMLTPLRLDNRAVVIVHHTTKDPDAVGFEAVRGSGALSGEVTTFATFREFGRDSTGTKRSMSVWSRPFGRNKMTIDFVQGDDGTPRYVLVTDSPDKDARRDRMADEERKVLALLAADGGWLPRSAVDKRAGVKSRTLDTLLPAMVASHKIETQGRGVKGDPLEYARKGTVGTRGKRAEGCSASDTTAESPRTATVELDLGGDLVRVAGPGMETYTGPGMDEGDQEPKRRRRKGGA